MEKSIYSAYTVLITMLLAAAILAATLVIGCSQLNTAVRSIGSEKVTGDCAMTDEVIIDEDNYSLLFDHCIPNQNGKDIFFVRYESESYRGKIYQVHHDADTNKSYIKRDGKDGKKVYLITGL